jgi:hypothetical protein
MERPIRLISFIIILLLTPGIGFTQNLKKQNPEAKAPQQALAPAAAGNPVTGSGTTSRLSRWTGVDGSNSFTLGNSIIFEDKFGKVGIGTTTPTSELTVQGMIETTLGGYKFPDGTIQTTAAVSGLQSIIHNATLTGNGTNGAPLGVAVPLELTGTVSGTTSFVLTVVNNGDGSGISGVGGNRSSTGFAGTGVTGVGGDSNANTGAGFGMVARGGNNSLTIGGTGLASLGGNGALFGGSGLDAIGGSGLDGDGGIGIRGIGGVGGLALQSVGSGGTGVIAIGGTGNGVNEVSGDGLFVRAGNAMGGAAIGRAAGFLGFVAINGDLNVTGTKNFRIDHPLDPENKYLVHAAIESSEILNVYSGNIKTNDQGEAIVTLPEWFEALNKDFRYQLTVVSTFAQAIVAEEISNNRFTIKTNTPGVKVSWQVTGVRSDAGMLKHPFKAEEDKPERERGTYLNPEAFNQPEEKGAEWARNPEIMRQMKEARLKQLEESKQKAPNKDR